jgi:tRNA-splicing ligase RtcB
MKIIDGIPVWGDPVDEGALAQIKTCAKDADHAALMADHHLGYSVPIGGVVAYENFINPAGVGYDIACGNKAVRLDIPAKEVKAKIHKIMDDVFAKISFGVGRANQEDVDHELFDDDAWKMEPAKTLKQKARAQLGTVGSGNHYVDIFTDEQDRVWVGVHFGSRGLGHGIASHFCNALGSRDSIDAKPMLASVTSPVGADYLQLMHLAGKYAYAGRDWVCARVAKILKADIVEEVHNHHNFAWKENHGGRDLWVVRKGATPAFPGQKGFVGGSMGDISVIIEGIENEHAGESLYSTVHGAGRTMSRTKAAGKMRGGKRTGGDVSREMMENWVRKKNVVLRGAGTDESPHCYKRLPEVLEQHAGTIRVLHTLTPIGVAMAGANEFDPYKD